MFLICLRHSGVSLQDRDAKESHVVVCQEGILEPGPQLSSMRGFILLRAWTGVGRLREVSSQSEASNINTAFLSQPFFLCPSEATV